MRCPREFSKGHFTKAINIPLFSDSQYEKIGQVYKKMGQENATEMGLQYASKASIKILKQISNRTYQIKNSIEWHKFQAGFT